MRVFQNSLFYYIRFVYFEMNASKVLFYQIEFEAYFERKHLYYKIIVWIIHFKIKVFMSVIKEKYY